MKQNLILVFGVIASILLIVNSTKRILSFRENWQQVGQAQKRFDQVKGENDKLKRELDYKRSQKFAEGEIRNKLGLVRDNEAVVILPQKETSGESQNSGQVRADSNWEKWWKLFFESNSFGS